MALVLDSGDGTVLYEKKPKTKKPIASLTKLMTAMVIIDSSPSWEEIITIKKADRDRLRGSASRLAFGTKLTRTDLFKIAVAGSENRATAALGRTYPGGKKAMIKAMNDKARKLGMNNTVFRDVSGLHSGNVSTASDLAILVKAAYRYDLIKNVSTLKNDFVTDLRKGYKVQFVNTNRLVRNKSWEISLSKTGYIADSGHCLVMRADLAGRPVIVVLLNSWGKLTKYGDSNRIRKWLESAERKSRDAAKAADGTLGQTVGGEQS
ncbi:MAG TPA: serine hydrolase [Nitrospiria bacterium]